MLRRSYAEAALILVLVAVFSAGACSDRRDRGELVKVEEYDRPFVWVGYRKNGKKHGRWIQMLGGKRIGIVYWRDGVQHGPSLDLEDDGTVWSDSYFRNGQLYGRSRFFCDNGQLGSLGWWQDTRQHGVWCEWDCEGRLEAIEHWHRGRKEHTVAYPEGECPHIVGTGRRHLDPNDRNYE